VPDAAPGDTTPGDVTTTTIDPDSPEATDPLVDEGPAETVPEGSGRYTNQPDFAETEVLWSSVREAEDRLAEAEEDHLLAVASVKTLRLRLKDIRTQIDGFDAETQQALEDLEAAEDLLELRALTAFVRGDSFESMGSIDHDAILESMAQQTMVEAVFNQDAVAISDIATLRDQLGVEVEMAYDRLAIVERLEAAAVDRVEEALAEIDQAELELRAFRAGSEVFIDGLVFPVGDGVQTPLIDSFGFARMTGTPDEHWHEGIDIFAPTGTPLYATERGVITRIGVGRLGGLKLWLRGESGTDWYYAHLSAFNDQLREGDLVEAGDLVGYVGQSGNAVGTPPHLHMQMHPGGNRPVNPYPLLNMRLELDREEALADQRES
jgi:murein DD-endopeptidase MepM/ murein hydrolase activator NlpD